MFDYMEGKHSTESPDGDVIDVAGFNTATKVAGISKGTSSSSGDGDSKIGRESVE